MIFNFNIYYNVEEGQDLYLNIVDGTEKVSSFKMNTSGDGNWTFELRKETRNIPCLDYYYSLVTKEEIIKVISKEEACKTPAKVEGINATAKENSEKIHIKETSNKVIRKEWLAPYVPSHHLPLNQSGVNSITTYDSWIDQPIDAHFFSEAFTHCLNKRPEQKPYQQPNPAVLRIKVFATQLKSNERLVLCGAHPVLGEWQPERGIPCTEVSHNVWTCDINTEYTANENLEFKFVAITKNTNPLEIGNDKASWEIGFNRTVTVPRIRKGEVVIYCQRPAAFERSMPRMAGTIIDIDNFIDSPRIRSIIEWMADTDQRWLCLNTKKMTRGNHSTELQELKAYAHTHRIVLEYKNTTHSLPLSYWWDKDKERAEDYYKNTLCRRDNTPHPIPSWLAHDIMMRKLLEQDTMQCLFYYEDWKLLGDITMLRLRDNIKEMIKQSGRIY